jgi:ABC-type branched-subunit amino acid transport system substrate-binding protein
VLAACGAHAPSGPAWSGEVHATREPGGGSAAASSGPSAPAALTPAAIDALDEASARAALARAGDRAPAARLALRLARIAHHEGDDAEARALLARAATAADEHDVHGALEALARQVAAPPVDRAAVAVLLPLSGRFARLGGELRAAIELVPPQGTRWLFLDTRGEPAGAIAAVDEAARRGAVAILGPVGTHEAVPAARAAALHHIPIGLLAPEDGADPASGVFRLVGSPADEARAVARVAAADGFPTVAVFAPRDDVGAEDSDAFIAEAQRLGLAVAAHDSYDPTGGDLAPDVKRLLGLDPAHNPRLAAHLARHPKDGWKTFSPDVPFSLLYVPDRYDRAALVAAFLPYYGVELRTTEFPDPEALLRKHGGRMPQVVQLVGGAGWDDPSLPARGGPAVQGALVLDPCPGALGGDASQAFADAFQQATGRAPGGAASEAFDAAALVAAARTAADPAGDPREAVRAALAAGMLDDGACGPAKIGPDGEITRDPTVLEVDGDALSPAP